jgi:hypothetical protein
MSFEKNGFEVVTKAFGEEVCDLLEAQFKIHINCEKHMSLSKVRPIEQHDTQVPFADYAYAANCFEGLMVAMHGKVEEVIGKDLFPCYSYARIMYTGAIMEKHKDRPSCQYSTTICVTEDKENPYPIFIENYDGEVSSVHLRPGDMLVYRGTKLNHWREEYKGKEQIQAFLHYVDANGPYKSFKFDKRPMIGLPSMTRQSVKVL